MSIRNWVIKKLGGTPSVKEKQLSSEITINFGDGDGMEETYLFDFKNWNGGQHNGIVTGTGVPPDVDPQEAAIIFGTENMTIGGIDSLQIVSKPNPKHTPKLKVKPVDVLDELERVPNPFTLSNLDEKLIILAEKRDLITQRYAKREIVGLIERLENRKKYFGETREFFERFPNTDEEKVDKLLSKYQLVMKSSDIFIPEFPDDAVMVMKLYTEHVKKLSGKKPVFSVIAEEKDFKKAYEKRDPILLAQSPFGFYYQILGAWDKEMILLHQL